MNKLHDFLLQKEQQLQQELVSIEIVAENSAPQLIEVRTQHTWWKNQ